MKKFKTISDKLEITENLIVLLIVLLVVAHVITKVFKIRGQCASFWLNWWLK
jgi:hypothetical protein